jgi:hypothetical protein
VNARITITRRRRLIGGTLHIEIPQIIEERLGWDEANRIARNVTVRDGERLAVADPDRVVVIVDRWQREETDA